MKRRQNRWSKPGPRTWFVRAREEWRVLSGTNCRGTKPCLLPNRTRHSCLGSTNHTRGLSFHRLILSVQALAFLPDDRIYFCSETQYKPYKGYGPSSLLKSFNKKQKQKAKVFFFLIYTRTTKFNYLSQTKSFMWEDPYFTISRWSRGLRISVMRRVQNTDIRYE